MSLQIPCKSLGVDHDGFVSGASLEDLINCIEQQLSEQAGLAQELASDPMVRDIVRSALIQTCRPAATRSIDLSRLTAAVAA